MTQARFTETLITPVFITSFHNIFTCGKDINGVLSDKYDLTMLFEKDTDTHPLEDFIARGVQFFYGGDAPKNLMLPFYNGWEPRPSSGEIKEIFKNYQVATAKTKFKPLVFDAKSHPITDVEAVYGGCYARAKIGLYAWKHSGKNGIGLNLSAYQKLADGVRFSGVTDVSDLLSADVPEIKNAIKPEEATNPLEDLNNLQNT